jgi:ribonuclease P protein component
VVNTTHQRFPRRARIRTSAEYQAVFSEGIRVSGAFFRCHLAENVQTEAQITTYASLGLAVSKRVDKNAVGRNRIKRACREWFRLHQAACLPVRYVLVAKPEAQRANAVDLRADLEKLFIRAHSLLTKNSTGTQHSQPETGIVSPQTISGD